MEVKIKGKPVSKLERERVTGAMCIQFGRKEGMDSYTEFRNKVTFCKRK